MLISLFLPGCRPPSRTVCCCLSLSRISRHLALSKYNHEQGISAREQVYVVLTDVFSNHRVIMFSSTPTVVCWRYQILAHPRGWLGSILALRLSQVGSDPRTKLLPSSYLQTHLKILKAKKKKKESSWLFLFIDTGCGISLKSDGAGWWPCDVSRQLQLSLDLWG